MSSLFIPARRNRASGRRALFMQGSCRETDVPGMRRYAVIARVGMTHNVVRAPELEHPALPEVRYNDDDI